MITRSKTSSSQAKGEIKVANEIVEKIAFLAASEVQGVADLSPRGKGLMQILGLTNTTNGVRVEVGTKEVAVDLDISVEYGSCIPEIVRNIRRNVTEKINSMTGLEVIELNINVNDLHFEEDRMPLPSNGQLPEPRVK